MRRLASISSGVPLHDSAKSPSRPIAHAAGRGRRNDRRVAAIGSIAAVGLGVAITLPLLALTLEDRGIPTTSIGINTAVWDAAFARHHAFRLAARDMGRHGADAGAVGARARARLPLFYLAPFWLWFPLRLVGGAALTVTFVLSEF